MVFVYEERIIYLFLNLKKIAGQVKKKKSQSTSVSSGVSRFQSLDGGGGQRTDGSLRSLRTLRHHR